VILQILGVRVFNLPEYHAIRKIGDIIDNLNAFRILSIITLTINMALLVSITANIKMKIETWVICFIISSISHYISLVDSRIIPTLMVLFIGLIFRSDSYRNVVFRYLNIMVITFIYQIFSGIYKTGMVAGIGNYTAGDVLLFSIDNYVLLVAIYIDKILKASKEIYKKGVSKHEKASGKSKDILGSLVYPFAFPSQEVQRNCAEDNGYIQEQVDLQSLSKWDKVVMAVVAIFQLGVVATACALNKKFIVFLIAYLLGFLPQKISTKMSYHAKSIIGCAVQSFIAFYVATALMPQIGISTLLPVCAGTAIIAIIIVLQNVGVLSTYE